jgi:hypothetical protein
MTDEDVDGENQVNIDDNRKETQCSGWLFSTYSCQPNKQD